YGDFTKVLSKNQQVDYYIDAMIMELESLEHKDFETIYVGGGTPTALSLQQLERLLSFIAERFTVSTEYTFEANPDEVTTEKLDLLRSEEHTSELQSRFDLVCRLLLETK